MKVNDLMTTSVKPCRTTATVDAALRTLLDGGCGCVPVVDTRGHLAGMLTEADVCRAVASHLGQPWALLARDVMSPAIVTCAPEDYLDTALVAMKEHRVRHVPVVDENRHVKGIILIEDAIRHTGTANGRLHAEAVMDVLRHICTPVADAEALI